MKYILITLVVLIIAGIITGYALKNNTDQNGEIIIGISVLVMAFIFMPLFIYNGYRNKKSGFLNLTPTKEKE